MDFFSGMCLALNLLNMGYACSGLMFTKTEYLFKILTYWGLMKNIFGNLLSIT